MGKRRMVKSKRCSGCGNRQKVDQFRPEERKTDGYGSRCLACRLDTQTAYRRKHRKQVNAKKRAYSSRPDVKKRRNARDRAKKAAAAKASRRPSSAR